MADQSTKKTGGKTAASNGDPKKKPAKPKAKAKPAPKPEPAPVEPGKDEDIQMALF